MKIEKALEQYLVNIQINEGLSMRTVRSYELDLNQYLEYLKIILLMIQRK